MWTLEKFKTHRKTKPNKTPHKQKNIAKNSNINKTKRQNHTQKNYFYYLFIEKMENLKTIDRDCLFNLLETATWGWDLSETEKRLESALDGNYNCKNTDCNYRKNSFLQSFEDLFRVIQQCAHFIK